MADFFSLLINKDDIFWDISFFVRRTIVLDRKIAGIGEFLRCEADYRAREKRDRGLENISCVFL